MEGGCDLEGLKLALRARAARLYKTVALRAQRRRPPLLSSRRREAATGPGAAPRVISVLGSAGAPWREVDLSNCRSRSIDSKVRSVGIKPIRANVEGRTVVGAQGRRRDALAAGERAYRVWAFQPAGPARLRATPAKQPRALWSGKHYSYGTAAWSSQPSPSSELSACVLAKTAYGPGASATAVRPQRFPLQLPRSSACVLAKTCHEALIFRASVAGES